MMIKPIKIDRHSRLATQIRHWYWDYVRTVQVIGPNELDPGARHHRLHDGGQDTLGRTWPPIWPQLAQWALDTKVDVQALLQGLTLLHKGRPCIAPQDIPIFSVQEIERALAARRQQVISDLSSRLRAELLLAEGAWQSLQNQVSQEQRKVVGRNGRMRRIASAEVRQPLWCAELTAAQIFEEVLLDPTLNVSPLVRLCLAYRQDVSHLTGYFHEGATRQYRSDPDAYDTVLRHLLPSAFRSAARAVLK
jgi:hypothetical protein